MYWWAAVSRSIDGTQSNGLRQQLSEESRCFQSIRPRPPTSKHLMELPRQNHSEQVLFSRPFASSEFVSELAHCWIRCKLAFNLKISRFVHDAECSKRILGQAKSGSDRDSMHWPRYKLPSVTYDLQFASVNISSHLNFQSQIQFPLCAGRRSKIRPLSISLRFK